ncbi:MAG: hypothetical protein WBM90_03965 [Acidimicrobiia bacterium]
MDPDPNQDRDEIYERIPWETLERKSGDRQWLILAIAGAITIGAVAYAVAQNRPLPVPPTPAAAPTALADSTSPPNGTTQEAVSSAALPPVIAEADLFAVDESEMRNQASGLAEWFAIEYFSVDGSSESAGSLAALLPAGLPLPEAADGTQVFVDWVGATEVRQVGPAEYEVDVIVRSLRSGSDAAFVRQPPRLAVVILTLGQDGTLNIAAPPVVRALSAVPTPAMSLGELPDEVQLQVADQERVIGGAPLSDGRWRVVAMVAGVDGVSRPETILVP